MAPLVLKCALQNIAHVQHKQPQNAVLTNCPRLLGFAPNNWALHPMIGLFTQQLGFSPDYWAFHPTTGLCTRLLGSALDCWACTRLLGFAIDYWELQAENTTNNGLESRHNFSAKVENHEIRSKVDPDWTFRAENQAF